MTMGKKPRLQFDLVETALWTLGAVLFASIAAHFWTLRSVQPYLSHNAEELQPLEAAYGGDRNSEHGEEWILRDFFREKRDGVFVDVGANDYKRFSNTYYLETALGWSGLAIEPQSKFAADYLKFRPKTTFVPLFVSDVSNEQATLYVPSNDLVASKSREFAETGGGPDIDVVSAATTTLDDILARSGINHVDFLSMDIELAEPEALTGFSIGRFEPALVCVEGHLPVRQQVLDYSRRTATYKSGNTFVPTATICGSCR
jgi:FkbM family methyltransferase